MSGRAPTSIADADGPPHPGQALFPGRSDAKRLLIAWYIRKSAYWLTFTGTTAAYLTDRTDEVDIDWGDAGSVVSELWSPLAGLVLAVVIRIGTGVAGLVLAYPVVRRYRSALDLHTGVRSWIGRLLDARQLTLAFRRWRWSHHVRQEALARLGTTGDRIGKLDLIIDIANVTSFIVLLAVGMASV